MHLRPFACTVVGALQPLFAQDPGAPAPAEAEAQEEAPGALEWIGRAPFSHWTRATGNWRDWRTQLEAAGVEVGGGYTSDWSAPWSGNVRRRDSYSSLLDVNVAFDLETLFGLPRTLVYVDAYAIHGSNPSRDLGDAQGVSNIQGNDVEQVAELWLETWLGDQLRLKVGKVDYNSEFAFNELGGDFVNSTAAITPTIVSYPTYPNPATAVNLFWQPSETWYAGVGIYDGANGNGIATGKRGPRTFFHDDESDAWFFGAEAGFAWTGGESWGSGRFALGAWHHTASFATFDGGTDRGTEGVYATFEQRIWREDPTAGDDQGIGMFLAAGTADDGVSAFANTITVGAIWNGIVPGRDVDGLGLAILHADLSDEDGAGTPEDETVFELLYRCQATSSIVVKPDLQYVQNAGGAAGSPDVLVAMLRLEVSF